MTSGNGQGNGESRLDRIERALELILDDHINFREEHKLLLQSQVLLQGSLEQLRDEVKELRAIVQETSAGLKQLSATVETMRADTDMRLRRLENPGEQRS